MRCGCCSQFPVPKTQQNADGTLSSNYFKGGEAQSDFDKRLASSGALLQFLIMVASDEQLKENWLRRAVEATVNDLLTNRNAYVSCSPLFTTTNAFGIYLERVVRSTMLTMASPLTQNSGSELHQTPHNTHCLENEKPEELIVVRYPVPDLVVRGAMGLTTLELSQSSDKKHENTKLEVTNSKNRYVFGPQVLELSFHPLTELIKTTIHPETWNDQAGVIRTGLFVEEKGKPKELLLSIRQTAAVHLEIATLLSQLRTDQNQKIRITCSLMKIPSDSHLKALEEHCSLSSMVDGQRWALLTKSRSDGLLEFLTNEEVEILSCPKIRTFSGQQASIEVCSEEAATFKEFRLSVNP